MTEIATPQAPADGRQVVRGIDAAGALVFEQVGFEDLDFDAVFGGKTTSSTENSIGLGTKTFTLDTDDGRIAVGYTVQIVCLDDADCFMYGFVTRKEETASPAELDVAISVTSAVGITASNWEIQIIAGPALGFESDTLAISETSAPFASGEATFTVAAGKFLPETASVLIRDLAHSGNYMYGTVKAYSDATLKVQIRNIFVSGDIASSSAWAIRLLDGPSATDTLVAEDWGLISQVAEGSAGGPEDYGFAADAFILSDDYDLVTAVVAESTNYGTAP